jgi:hypothetical protein
MDSDIKIIIKNPRIGRYISGKIIKEINDGNVSNWKIALLIPLPKLLMINIEGIIPINVPIK